MGRPKAEVVRRQRQEQLDFELDIAAKQLKLSRMRRAQSSFGGGSFSDTQSATLTPANGSLGSHAYHGAGYTRGLLDWTPWRGDADQELRDIDTLRERAMDLDRNNPTARGISNTLTTNIIGMGIKMQSAVDRKYLGLDDAAAEAWENETERLFEQWMSECDAGGRFDFFEMQEIAFRSYLVTGDSITLLPIVQTPKSERFAFKLLMVESHQLCNENHGMDTAKIKSGIQLGDYERPEGYWIRTQIYPEQWAMVPAFGEKSNRRNVIHLFRPDRPKSKRGIPIVSAIMELLKQFGRYTDSEVMAAVVQAAQSLFIRSNNPDSLDIGSLPAWDSDSRPSYKVGPGVINRLEQDEDIVPFSPQRPNPNFDGFIKTLLLQVSMAVNVPYEMLVKKYEASYSASRGARIDAERDWNARRKWFSRKWCQLVYEEWLYWMIANGNITAPGYIDDAGVRFAYSRAMWIGDSMGQLDPLKEVSAAKMRIDEGLSTRTQETAGLNGGSFEKNMGILKTEEQLAQEQLGRKLGGTNGTAGNTSMGDQAGQTGGDAGNPADAGGEAGGAQGGVPPQES